jgi:hypothetical protein
MPVSSSDFVWSEDGPIGKLGFIGERKEGTEIVGRTIERYPRWVLRDALADTYQQLGLSRTGDGLASRADAHSPTVQLRRFYPADFATYLNSRQNRGQLAHMHVIPEVDSDFLLISIVDFFLVGILFASRRQWLPLELIGTVGFAILLHAFVTGALADPTNRYGSRIIWLIPLIAIASWRTALGWGTGERRELPLSRDG